MKWFVLIALVLLLGGVVYQTGRWSAVTTTPNETVPVIEEATPSKYKDLIRIDAPTTNATVTSPLTITGAARGPWYFEATFPVVVVDWDGLIIGEGYAEATGNWMTEDYVPFTATVTFTVPADTPYRRGSIILQKANASGLPEHDDAVEMPVRFE